MQINTKAQLKKLIKTTLYLRFYQLIQIITHHVRVKAKLTVVRMNQSLLLIRAKLKFKSIC